MKLRERDALQRAELDSADREYLASVPLRMRGAEAVRLAAYRELEATLEDDEELFYPDGVEPDDIIRDSIHAQKRKKGKP